MNIPLIETKDLLTKLGYTSPSVTYMLKSPQDYERRKPIKGTKHSAGYDFTYYGPEITIEPGQTKMVNTQIRLAIPNGTVLIMKTRSSFAKFNVMVQAGVIDSDYRGDIIVCLQNLGGTPFVVHSGMKIAQGILLNYLDMNISFVDEDEWNKLDKNNERGIGGFGSTGLVKYE